MCSRWLCSGLNFCGLPVIPLGKIGSDWKSAEKQTICHCEERFLRRGNLEVIDLIQTEIASRSFIPV
jgi:hypothetical protein